MSLINVERMDALNLWLKYPLMMEYAEENDIVYRGTIDINNEDYKISVTKRNEDSFTFALPEKLILRESEIYSAINNLERKNIVTILDTLVMVITSKVPSTVLVNHCDIYRHVLYEYSEFTKFYMNLKFCSLAYDLSKIDVTAVDERGREHSVGICVNFDNEKGVFRIATSELPEDKELFKESSSLKVIYDQFLTAIEALQPFFNLMDVLDKNSWILDPVEPKRKATYRRICLGENLSVVVTVVDPYNVTNIPDMKFLGPERLVDTYRQKLNENLQHWMYENDIYSEILKLLGMDCFPQKTADDEKRFDILKDVNDCSICFSLRLNEHLPEVVCKNKFCENYYHVECLYEWLNSVNARRFFSEVVGQCPNCEKNISCPIPK